MRALILALLLATAPVFAGDASVKNYRVVDGDTVEIQVDWLPKELGSTMKVRIWGIDTPEKGHRAACDMERKLGAKATEFTTKMMMEAKVVDVVYIKWDKFGGRVLGDLIIDGNSLRVSLIKSGLAREYFGEKKLSWCKK